MGPRPFFACELILIKKMPQIIFSSRIKSLPFPSFVVDFKDKHNISWSYLFDTIHNKYGINKNIIRLFSNNNKIVDYKDIHNIAKKYNLKIIEDAAQSICSSYKGKKSGYYSNACAFSFNPMKVLNSYGEAGVITTNNKKIFNKLSKNMNKLKYL